MYINVDNIIVFIGLSVLTFAVWGVIVHISTYFECKERFVKPEYIKEFTFWRYTASELKRHFTGKGLF